MRCFLPLSASGGEKGLGDEVDGSQGIGKISEKRDPLEIEDLHPFSTTSCELNFIT
jgi:hypothetical protein